jgi:hypothetical protein
LGSTHINSAASSRDHLDAAWRIHGKIETAEGVLGSQELAIVPVEVRCI